MKRIWIVGLALALAPDALAQERASAALRDSVRVVAKAMHEEGVAMMDVVEALGEHAACREALASVESVPLRFRQFHQDLLRSREDRDALSQKYDYAFDLKQGAKGLLLMIGELSPTDARVPLAAWEIGATARYTRYAPHAWQTLQANPACARATARGGA